MHRYGSSRSATDLRALAQPLGQQPLGMQAQGFGAQGFGGYSGFSAPMGMSGGGSMMSDRLDAMEQELEHLRALRAAQDSGLSAHLMAAQQQAPILMNTKMPHQPALPQPMALQLQPPASPISYGNATGGSSADHMKLQKELMQSHQELMGCIEQQEEQHKELMKSHSALMEAHTRFVSGRQAGGGKAAPKKHPALGVIRLDYLYPPAEGDTDCPGSYGYDVYYRVVPGLTFEMAQRGKFTEEIERNFAEGIKYLEQRGVSAMTGDCGFMMAFQVLARKIASKPVFMSSMVQCPVLAAAFEKSDKILILTANGASLRPQKEVLLSSCGFHVDHDRFVIQGCQDVPGFDAVAKGEAVPLELVQPGIVKLTMENLKRTPEIKAILLECTELPAYADALRAATGLPVWDAITGADFYVSGCKDNARFGIEDWQAQWDGHQEAYQFGANLIEMDKKELVHDPTQRKAKAKAHAKTKDIVKKTKRNAKKSRAPILGVVRLDYNYPPAAGDIDCPGSYDYQVLFRCVPGLTFDMAQAGKMTPKVEQEFKAAVRWLEAKGASGITGDCGFMMAFQTIARQVVDVPVFLSSMIQCPMVSCAFDKYDKVLILTANSETLMPQKGHLLSECGFDVDDDRFVIRGCQDVPGFDAVAKGAKVDVEYVTPGMVKMVKDILKRQPTIRAIVLECTELPPYADALRNATGLSVFDAITCADFFISARQDNPRFGLNQWQNDWDGTIAEYTLGQNLTADQRSRLLNA